MLLCLLLFATAGISYSLGTTRSPEVFVKTLYAAISFQPGTLPDWNSVENMFHDKAIITLRASRDKVSVFTLTQWIQDFKDFIVNRQLEQIGFYENVAGIKVFEFGDMAHVLVIRAENSGRGIKPAGGGQYSFDSTGWKLEDRFNPQ